MIERAGAALVRRLLEEHPLEVPRREAEIFALHFGQGLTLETVAAVLGLRRSTVRQYVRGLRRRARHVLGEEEGDK
jgi:DNA-directed RNA polymerase specialized sigma24 family protein